MEEENETSRACAIRNCKKDVELEGGRLKDKRGSRGGRSRKKNARGGRKSKKGNLVGRRAADSCKGMKKKWSSTRLRNRPIFHRARLGNPANPAGQDPEKKRKGSRDASEGGGGGGGGATRPTIGARNQLKQTWHGKACLYFLRFIRPKSENWEKKRKW